MRVKFTNHAQASLFDRGIEASRVVDTLRAPDSTSPGHEGKKLSRKRFGRKILEVVYIQERGRKPNDTDYLVITAYYL